MTINVCMIMEYKYLLDGLIFFFLLSKVIDSLQILGGNPEKVFGRDFEMEDELVSKITPDSVYALRKQYMVCTAHLILLSPIL